MDLEDTKFKEKKKEKESTEVQMKRGDGNELEKKKWMVVWIQLYYMHE